MKPSQRIIQIIKDMAREEAQKRGGYFGWEGLEGLSSLIAQIEFMELLPLAILNYLDEVIVTKEDAEVNKK